MNDNEVHVTTETMMMTMILLNICFKKPFLKQRRMQRGRKKIFAGLRECARKGTKQSIHESQIEMKGKKDHNGRDHW